MGNAEENKVIDLDKHRGLEKTPAEVTDFQQKFAGEILNVVRICDKPDADWVPFASLVKSIMAGKMDPATMADEISKLRDENKNNKAA